MLYKTISAAVYGIDANLIQVEVDISPIKEQEARFTTVGLPDAAVRESRERVRAALFIAGGGFFTKFVQLPLSLAWEAFGIANGVHSFDEGRKPPLQTPSSPTIPALLPTPLVYFYSAPLVWYYAPLTLSLAEATELRSVAP